MQLNINFYIVVIFLVVFFWSRFRYFGQRFHSTKLFTFFSRSYHLISLDLIIFKGLQQKPIPGMDKEFKGKAGEKGNIGDIGYPGDRGEMGPVKLRPGMRGAKGENGSQGLTGDAGDSGPMGPAGKDGVKGKYSCISYIILTTLCIYIKMGFFTAFHYSGLLS